MGDYVLGEFESGIELGDGSIVLHVIGGDEAVSVGDANETVVVTVDEQRQTLSLEESSLELNGGGGRPRPFDPVVNELDATFRLTNYSAKGRNDRPLGMEVIGKLLGKADGDQEDQRTGMGPMGVSFTELQRNFVGGRKLAHVMDLMQAVVDDPYMQGKIACAKLLGNLYGFGVTEFDSIQIFVGVAAKLTDKERDVVVPLIMKGFKDAAIEAETTVRGGQILSSPWLCIGGSALSVCGPESLSMGDGATSGDVLILTKPLGTQIAINAYQAMVLREKENWDRIKLNLSESDVHKAYSRAIDSMARLNRLAAILMHVYNAHCAIVVDENGLLNQAKRLVEKQISDVSFMIHNLPVIAKMTKVAKQISEYARLITGSCAEYSGGLLICLPRDQAATFCKDIEKRENRHAWIVGIVQQGDRTARVIDKPRIIEVPVKDKQGELW